MDTIYVVGRCAILSVLFWNPQSRGVRRCSTACNADQPFADLLDTAMVVPMFEGGTVGIRRRHLQFLMLSNDYGAEASTSGPSRQAHREHSQHILTQMITARTAS